MNDTTPIITNIGINPISTIKKIPPINADIIANPFDTVLPDASLCVGIIFAITNRIVVITIKTIIAVNENFQTAWRIGIFTNI